MRLAANSSSTHAAAVSPCLRSSIRPTPRSALARSQASSAAQAASEVPAGAAVAAAATTTAALLEWMNDAGCVVHGVELQYGVSAGGQVVRELCACKDLSPGEVLVSVPLDCTIHYKEADIQQPEAASAVASDSNVHVGSAANSKSSGNSSTSSSSQRAALRALQGRVPMASDGSHGAWQFKMALEVLFHAMDKHSPLQPYIQTLPGACPGIPTPQVAMLWPSQQLQECQSAQLAADAASQAYWLEAYSRDVLAGLAGSSSDAFGGQLVTQERLGWALAVSMSRAFGFKKLGGYALAPLIDMANHAPVSNAEVRYSDDTGRVNLIANSKVPAGQPILLNYGAHDNANLLLSYGFVVPDNASDRFRVNLDMDTLLAAILQFVGGDVPPSGRATDSLKQWQRTALQTLGLLSVPPAAAATNTAAAASAGAAAEAASQAQGGLATAPDVSAAADKLPAKEQQQADQQQQQQQQPIAVCIGGQPPVSRPLLAAVRVVLAQDRAAVKSRSLQQLGDWDHPLSAQHEALVMKALVGLCTVLYKSFPTSIQQDRAALASLQQQEQQPPGNIQSSLEEKSEEQPHQPQEVDALFAERAVAAVQFRLGQKLLLEQSTKQLIQRLQQLVQ